VTPGGEELVVMPRAEYEALLERAEAEAEEEELIAIYDARKAAGGTLLPDEVSVAIHRGQTRLRAIRTWRGLKQAQLCDIAGITQAYLSDLETGRRAGTPETLEKLAGALDVPIGWIS